MNTALRLERLDDIERMRNLIDPLIELIGTFEEDCPDLNVVELLVGALELGDRVDELGIAVDLVYWNHVAPDGRSPEEIITVASR